MSAKSVINNVGLDDKVLANCCTYYVGYYFLLRLDERGRTCRLYNRVPTTIYIQAIGLTSYDTQ